MCNRHLAGLRAVGTRPAWRALNVNSGFISEIPAGELEITRKPWKSHKNHGNYTGTNYTETMEITQKNYKNYTEIIMEITQKP